MKYHNWFAYRLLKVNSDIFCSFERVHSRELHTVSTLSLSNRGLKCRLTFSWTVMFYIVFRLVRDSFWAVNENRWQCLYKWMLTGLPSENLKDRYE